MSNSVKSKFAGLFRGLFGRASEPETTPAPVAATRPVTSAAPAVPPAQPATTAARTVDSVAAEDVIALPLAPIVASLPMELRAKMMNVPAPGAAIHIPVETVVSQLAFGAVKISFGELRQLAAGLFANAGGEHDLKMISLPLNEILPRLNPALLARHTRQRVEVDNDIKGPFAAGARGVSFTSQPLKSPAPAQLPPKRETEFITASSRLNPPLPISPLIVPSAPLPAAPLPPSNRVPAPSAPAAPTVPPTPAAPAMPITPISSITPLSPAAPTTPVNGNGNGHTLPPTPKIKFTAAPAPVPPAPAPSPAPVAPRPEPAQPMIQANLWDLAEGWPEELKNEILSLGLGNANVSLAGSIVDAGLKRGRVTMTWKQLRVLAKPSSSPSMNDNLELDLPLKVIAPLFFAVQKSAARGQKKQVVSEEIPNLFFGFPQPAPEPTTPAPASLPKNHAAPPASRHNTDSTFFVWGDDGETPKGEENIFAPPPVPQTDFTNRMASPKEIVDRAINLPGVAGVVVALPDGLRVASHVSSDLNADTLAAFVPQIFERMNQSAKELRMGALGNISFTVGDIAWRIYRVNAVYVAAFGRPGQSLPAAQLAALANELNRKNY